MVCCSGAPYETRTRVSGVRGQRPGPLDEGSNGVLFKVSYYRTLLGVHNILFLNYSVR